MFWLLVSASDFEITSSRPKDFLNYINKLQWRRQAGARGAHAPPVIGLAPPVPPQEFMTVYVHVSQLRELRNAPQAGHKFP